jgi:hypothetical protein
MSTTERYLELKAEAERRQREAVRLYRPSPQQEPIHLSKAPEVLVNGGKRAGKTVAVSTEFAHRVTGMPLYDSKGNEIPNKWPIPTKEFPRLFWIIGWNLDHIGQTIHRILFQPGMGGQMRCIPDEHTGEWRIWNRSNPIDAKRVSESHLTEPLIPSRFIIEESWAWNEKRSNQFSSVELINGAKICAYPSSGIQAKQGDAVSGLWIDEDIQFPGHLREWQDRLTDEEGWFLWSVWPHMKNEALLGLMERAERDEYEKEPQIKKFQLIMTSNTFLTDKGKEQSLGRMETDEEIARRNRGEVLMDALSMYAFDNNIHCIRRPDPNRRFEAINPSKQILIDMWLAGGFPREWTRYLSIDPSHTRTACHSWVVPPIEFGGVFFGNMAICEWELVGRRWSAAMLAQEIFNRAGSRNYEAYIMDKRAGRQTHAGRDAGDNVFHVYSQAFQNKGLVSRITGSSFVPGVDVPTVRYRCVRDMLGEQPGVGLPSVLFVEEACGETRREFAKYRKKTEVRGEGMDTVLDEPANPRLYDCMASLEYFAAFIHPAFMGGTAWVDPTLYASRGSGAYRAAQKILERRRGRDEGSEGVVYMQAGEYT